MNHDMLLILDFGGTQAQDLARRLRGCQIYCELRPFDLGADEIAGIAPRGVILAGDCEDGEAACDAALFSLGLPVLVEYSSYEPHPLGRVEWIKLYGLLCGKLPEAGEYFDRQAAIFHAVENTEPSGKTVAFFHLSPSGGVTVRRRADYITRMIELAGGETAITDLPAAENALSTETIQMESFYAQARGADVLIYNGTAVGAVPDMEAFLALSPLFADFKAVRENEVWCTEKSMFQRSSAAADMIKEIRAAVSGDAGEDLRYLHRIQ